MVFRCGDRHISLIHLFPTSHMGIEKEILLLSWGNSAFINSMNAQICRCCSSFNDATYLETEAIPMLHLHGWQMTIKSGDKRRKTAISDGFSDQRCLLLPKKMQKSVGLHPKPIEAQRGGFDLERRSRRMSAFRHSELSIQNRYSCSGSAFSRLRFWGVEKSITMAICALSKNSDC